MYRTSSIKNVKPLFESMSLVMNEISIAIYLFPSHFDTDGPGRGVYHIENRPRERGLVALFCFWLKYGGCFRW